MTLGSLLLTQSTLVRKINNGITSGEDEFPALTDIDNGKTVSFHALLPTEGGSVIASDMRMNHLPK